MRLVVNNRKHWPKNQEEVFECVKCLQLVVVVQPLLKVLVHPEHIRQETQDIEEPLQARCWLDCRPTRLVKIVVPIIINEMRDNSTSVIELNETVSEHLGHQVGLELTIAERSDDGLTKSLYGFVSHFPVLNV